MQDVSAGGDNKMAQKPNVLPAIDTTPPRSARQQFVEQHEGYRDHVYDDHTGEEVVPGQKVEGYLTAGVGHKLTKTEIADWYSGDLDLSDEQIALWFHQDMEDASQKARSAIGPAYDDLTPNQRLAVDSYVFNAGNHALQRLDPNTGKFSAEPTNFVKNLQQGNLEAATAEMDIVKSKGKELEGLKSRREAEQALMFSDVDPKADSDQLLRKHILRESPRQIGPKQTKVGQMLGQLQQWDTDEPEPTDTIGELDLTDDIIYKP